jgi:excisionase family DNA binding protein
VAGGFCTVREGAQRLGVSKSTMIVLLDKGAVDYVRPTGPDGRARRVSIASLNRYIADNLVHSG